MKMKYLFAFAALLTASAVSAQNRITLTTDEGVEDHRLSDFQSVEFGAGSNVVKLNPVSTDADPIVYDDQVRKMSFFIERPVKTDVQPYMAYSWNFSNRAWMAFAYGSVMHIRDLLTADMTSTLSNYNQFSYWQNLEFLDTRYVFSNYLYRWFYEEAIPAVNQLIKSLDPATCPQSYLADLGAAYTYRAMLYLDYARMYEYLPNERQSSLNEWGNDVSGLTVPILTEDMSADDIHNMRRATREEVTAFILSDLSKAETYLAHETDADPRYPHLDVLYGLKARLYMWLGDYAAARTNARKAIDVSSSKPMTESQWLSTTKGFNDRSLWMWGAQYDPDTSGANYVVSWTGWMSPEATWGYTGVGVIPLIGASVLSRIDVSDFRRNTFKSPSHWSNPTTVNYIDGDGSDYPDYTAVKFRPNEGYIGNGSLGTLTAFPLMRVEEMYFIEAEAAAHSSESEGRRLLNNFMKTYRVPTYNYTGTSLIDEIIFQKRVELWGEGQSYFDIKRLDMPVVRNYEGTNFPSEYDQSNTTARPYWLNLLFPKTIMDTYPNMKEWNNPSPDLDENRAGVNPSFTITDIYDGNTIRLDSIDVLYFDIDDTNADNSHVDLNMQFSERSDFSNSFKVRVTRSPLDKNFCLSLNDSVAKYISPSQSGKPVTYYVRGIGLYDGGPIVSASNTITLKVATSGKKQPAYLYFDEGGHSQYRSAIYSEMFNISVPKPEEGHGFRMYDVQNSFYGDFYIVPTTLFGVLPAAPAKSEIDLSEETDNVALVSSARLATDNRCSNLLRIGDYYIALNDDGTILRYHLCSFLKTHFTRADLQNGLNVQLVVRNETDVMRYYAASKPFKLKFKGYDSLFNGGEFYFDAGNPTLIPNGSTKVQLLISRLNRNYVGADYNSSDETFTCHLSSNNPHVSVPATITMGSEQKGAYVELTIDEAFFTGAETATITIDQADGFAIEQVQLTIKPKVENWKMLGTGYYEDNAFGASGNVTIEQDVVNPNSFRIQKPYPDSSAPFVFTILQPGDTYLGVTLTYPDLVVYDDYDTGIYDTDYNQFVTIMHPGRFSKYCDEDYWLHNKVLSYQSNGLPEKVQIAPVYYLSGIGGWYYMGQDNVIIITFPTSSTAPAAPAPQSSRRAASGKKPSLPQRPIETDVKP